ncbi:MAG: VWA domain-containing protein [Bryobacterales bacterium]|nr:VWA domain-containing protein [Bryobacteraceae bacterium]MDW8353405.1 VWA domain-containing protein [Bryobacterales bacterium]
MRSQLSCGRRPPQHGVVLLLTTLALLFVVIPVVGLAIDAGVAYATKGRLQTATDGAALAAGRSLSRGLDLASQRTSAVQTAEAVFRANFVDGWLGAFNPQISVSFPAAPPKTSIVRVETSVAAPTYFMRIFAVNSLTVRSVAEATRRDVNVMMVLDRSGSLAESNSCGPLRVAANSFVHAFLDGRDRVGLITFGTTYNVDFPLAFDFRSRSGTNLPTMINNIACVGGTNAAAPYWLAYQQLRALNEPGALNVILFFTDGQPNSLHMPALQVRASSPCIDKSDKNGVVAPAGTQVWGVFRALETGPPPAPNPDWRVVPGSTGCYYASSYRRVVDDIVALTRPGAHNEVDVYGNSLVGYKTPIRRDGSGRIRLNDWETVTNAATNALDNAAQRVRNESVLNGLDVVTYCIALGGPGEPEQVLMRRIANVPQSPIYDPSKPVGGYIYAADANALHQAFAQVASDILRLSM